MELMKTVCTKGAAGVSIRASVLVHGPSGSGKATAARAAATAMGLHVVPFGCAGLHRGDGQAAPRLGAAFEAASSFGPAVLLLMGLELLVGSAADAGSNPGQDCSVCVEFRSLHDRLKPAVCVALCKPRLVRVCGCAGSFLNVCLGA